MKIQNLAVIFIVIILPISLVISTYTKNQIKVVSLQASYDSKLRNATYDAIKAYQMNAAKSGSADIASSRMRDIEASANSFYNSVASNFNMKGYNKDVLKEYVPVLVYTMYDGLYLYSNYTNYLNGGDTTSAPNKGGVDVPNNATYANGTPMYGLRPYVYYSCRYKRGGPIDDPDIDVVITYSLDNYIVIEGIAKKEGGGKEAIKFSGNVTSTITMPDSSNKSKYHYRGVDIEPENTKEIVYNNSKENSTDSSVIGAKVYDCRKIDGIKYYCDRTKSFSPPSTEGKDLYKFSFLNDKYLEQRNGLNVVENKNAVLYCKEAMELKQKMEEYGLLELQVKDAVDMDGNSITDEGWAGNSDPIFDEMKNDVGSGNKTPEEKDSLFNQHRLQVIRRVIENNLETALANYNNSMGTHAFQLPKFKEDEWEKILNNITLISFMQGVNMGGRTYSGYSIVPNNENEDVVTDDSIYLVGNDDNYYYPVTYGKKAARRYGRNNSKQSLY